MFKGVYQIPWVFRCVHGQHRVGTAPRSGHKKHILPGVCGFRVRFLGSVGYCISPARCVYARPCSWEQSKLHFHLSSCAGPVPLSVDRYIYLIDVRTDIEYASGHIPGSIHLPLHRISDVPEAVPDKNARIFFYCLSGARSHHACMKLARMGYSQALYFPKENAKVYTLKLINWLRPVNSRIFMYSVEAKVKPNCILYFAFVYVKMTQGFSFLYTLAPEVIH